VFVLLDRSSKLNKSVQQTANICSKYTDSSNYCFNSVYVQFGFINSTQVTLPETGPLHTLLRISFSK